MMQWIRRFMVVLALSLGVRVITGFCRDDIPAPCPECMTLCESALDSQRAKLADVQTEINNLEGIIDYALSAWEELENNTSPWADGSFTQLGTPVLYAWLGLSDQYNCDGTGPFPDLTNIFCNVLYTTNYVVVITNGNTITNIDVLAQDYCITNIMANPCSFANQINSADSETDSGFWYQYSVIIDHYLEIIQQSQEERLSVRSGLDNNFTLVKRAFNDLKESIDGFPCLPMCDACSTNCEICTSNNCPPAYIESNCLVTCVWVNAELVCITNCIDTNPHPGMSNDCDCIIAALAPFEDMFADLLDEVRKIRIITSNILERVEKFDPFLEWVQAYQKPTWYKKWFVSPLVAEFPVGSGDGVITNRLAGWTIERKEERVEGFTGRWFDDNIKALEMIYEELTLANAIAALNASNMSMRIEEEQSLESITNDAKNAVEQASASTNGYWGLTALPDIGHPIDWVAENLPDMPNDAVKQTKFTFAIPIFMHWDLNNAAIHRDTIDVDLGLLDGSSDFIEFCRLLCTLFHLSVFCYFVLFVALGVVRIVWAVLKWAYESIDIG